ncbi:type II toxin-antitoxin system VapB family antitoxin [Burkholderia sp. Tr-20390]|uniref:type II toxin-antitoxin system VapB family antitoxin n=1 Tax=Burkholderia sp. Tr-20390 TaxID=2703904 RepID=UPI001980C843|nr:type II toxin-antitoxin system VapB family antitoxin [Burkholderia sp. Tr-20390]MBN3731077.1 type II toxin-antitoxin system VapB family antitoxin [Burkholderia sp. Tr-20390]
MWLNVTIDGDLFAKAVQTAGPGVNEADVLQEVINTLVRVEAARRLAALGGTLSGMADIPWRRPEPESSRGNVALPVRLAGIRA